MQNKIHSESNSNTKSESGIKGQKSSPRMALKDLQQNREELDRCKKNPVYFYNSYVRKEGQPILSENEYKEKMKVEFNKRSTVHTKPMFVLIDELQEEYIDTVRKINAIMEKEKDATT